MNDAHAADVTLQRFGEKFTQHLLAFAHGETVQVELGLHAIMSAPELAKHGVLHAGSRVGGDLSARKVRIIRLDAQALIENGSTIGASEARVRRRLRGGRDVAVVLERTHTARRLTEQRRLVVRQDIVSGWGLLREPRASLPRGSLTRYIDAPLRAGHDT